MAGRALERQGALSDPALEPAVVLPPRTSPATGRQGRIKTFIFNVKGFDLFWLDRWSNKFTESDLRTWADLMARSFAARVPW